MIKVRTTNKFLQEKEYIINVVFENFLGHPAEILIDDSISDDKYVLQFNDDIEHVIIFPCILFNKSENEWLKKESFPLLPLRRRSVLDFLGVQLYNQKDLVVIYGLEREIQFEPQLNKSYFDIDILGSIFFLLTQYEEIDTEEVDEFGRYDYKRSILFNQNLLQRPIVNEYLECLSMMLKEKFSLDKKTRNYQLLVSHDVDVPLIGKQPLFHFFRSLCADLLVRKSVKVFAKRFITKSSFGFDRNHLFDPHNNFELLMGISESLGIRSQFNFIARDGKGSIDGSYDIRDPFFKKCLLNIYKRGHIIGFHGSYSAYNDQEKLAEEVATIKSICVELGIPHTQMGGRQHYLKWKNPITWRLWEQNGLSKDSSIGSEYFLGFRSSVCYPYPVYDLEMRKQLNLIEFPLIVMDIAAFKLGKIKNYKPQVEHLSKVIKHYNGIFTLLYHNNYIISAKQIAEYKKLLDAVV